MRLDPATVQSGKWNPRDTGASADSSLLRLVEDIAARGTNVVPVTVRPMAAEVGASNSDARSHIRHELVAGSRRLRACAIAGVPVVAQVVNLSDREAVRRLHSENVHRKSWSALERGRLYTSLLDSGTYSSAIDLARDLVVDAGDVSRAVSLARLPEALLEVLEDPHALALHDAQRFNKALRADADGAVQRAREAFRVNGAMSPRALLEWLEGKTPSATTSAGATHFRMPVHVDGIEVGQAEVGRSGTLTIAIHSHPADCSATDFCVALVHSVAAAWERITGKGRDSAQAEDH